MGFFAKLFAKEKDKQVKKVSTIADKITALEPTYSSMDDATLKAQTSVLKARLKDETLDDILPDAFAVVREAGKRVLNMRHFDVQLIGGIVLHQGRIAEMRTGEGKTLVATLPAYLNALTEKGVHIVTVNDYLAKRDAEWMGKIFLFLGMTVGVVVHDMSQEAKKQAYAADITYGTNNEFGFDYLRDNMSTQKSGVMQRGHNFAIIDEVDSILIDEARTPLIISAPQAESSEIYIITNRFVKGLHADDYVMDEKEKHVYLSEEGVERAEKYFRVDNLGDAENAELMQRINSALRANILMHNNKDYIVEGNEVVIVDEFTGRKMAGRRYSEGLHQAIEAKENVKVNKENRTVATITFQNLFRLYTKLAGMTGTAMTEEDEFKGIYNLDVVPIPTNLPMIRRDEPDKIYLTLAKKYQFVVDEIKDCYARKQPLLVGTISVEVSEMFSSELIKARIPHNVLNAKSNREEAEIIAQAGKLGAITIATNMAGRGTDILLGGNPEYMAKQKMIKDGYTEELINIASAYNTVTDEEEVKARNLFKSLISEYRKETDKEKEAVIALGGLRVVGTERHESRRIDNQLRGRSGRQGDIGSSCFYLSFEDDLLRLFGGDKLKALVSSLVKDEDTVIQMKVISNQIETAQKRCEENNYQRRKYVLNYDDVMNKQRQLIYSQRNEVLDGKDVHDQILKFLRPAAQLTVEKLVDFSNNDETTLDYALINSTIEQTILPPGTNIVTETLCRRLDQEEVVEVVYKKALDLYEEKVAFAETNGIDFKETERNVLLNIVDRHWMEHIDSMDALRRGIGLRGYGQKDPVTEYRREGFEMFDDMIDSIQRDATVLLLKLDINQVVDRKNAYEKAAAAHVTVVREKKSTVGRNDPCPCGSGRKYKNCCGK